MKSTKLLAKILLMTLCISLLIGAFAVSTSAAPSNGQGTEFDPYYVTSEYELYEALNNTSFYSSTVYITLGNSLTLTNNSYSYYDAVIDLNGYTLNSDYSEFRSNLTLKNGNAEGEIRLNGSNNVISNVYGNSLDVIVIGNVEIKDSNIGGLMLGYSDSAIAGYASVTATNASFGNGSSGSGVNIFEGDFTATNCTFNNDFTAAQSSAEVVITDSNGYTYSEYQPYDKQKDLEIDNCIFNAYTSIRADEAYFYDCSFYNEVNVSYGWVYFYGCDLNGYQLSIYGPTYNFPNVYFEGTLLEPTSEYEMDGEMYSQYFGDGTNQSDWFDIENIFDDIGGFLSNFRLSTIILIAIVVILLLLGLGTVVVIAVIVIIIVVVVKKKKKKKAALNAVASEPVAENAEAEATAEGEEEVSETADEEPVVDDEDIANDEEAVDGEEEILDDEDR